MTSSRQLRTRILTGWDPIRCRRKAYQRVRSVGHTHCQAMLILELSTRIGYTCRRNTIRRFRLP